jgi:hypothetical protein
MECSRQCELTNEVKIMIHQTSISVKLSETDAAVTNFPGVVPLAKLAHDLGLLADLERLLPAKERARGYANSAAAFDVMCIPLSGGECIDDLAALRSDTGLARLLGRKVMAPSTAHDFLRRIRYDGLDALAQVRRRMLRRVAKRTKMTGPVTLDCDASLFTSCGRNAHMSYTGARGYMPMLAFWSELGLVVHDDFRNGNASPGGDALAFLKATLAQLPREVGPINIRSDSAWYQAELLDYCEDKGHGFCIGADQDEAVKKTIMAVNEEDWHPINVPKDPKDKEDYVREWACETVHTLNKSKHAYRMILIRKERRQGDLFEGAYAYSAIITNMDLALEEHVAWYRARGNCENQIKELKWDFELRVLPSGDFFVNAIYLRLITLAYNLFTALKLLKLPESWRPLQLKTLLFRLLGLPALVTRHARRLYLKLPRGHPHLTAFRLAMA